MTIIKLQVRSSEKDGKFKKSKYYKNVLCGLIQGKNLSFILVFIEFIVSEIHVEANSK